MDNGVHHQKPSVSRQEATRSAFSGPFDGGGLLFPPMDNGVHLTKNLPFSGRKLLAQLFPALLTAARQHFTAIRRFHPFPESAFALTFLFGWMICHLHRLVPLCKGRQSTISRFSVKLEVVYIWRT